MDKMRMLLLLALVLLMPSCTPTDITLNGFNGFFLAEDFEGPSNINLRSFSVYEDTDLDYQSKGTDTGVESDFNSEVSEEFYPNAVPEPATMILFGGGALGSALLRRRKKL